MKCDLCGVESEFGAAFIRRPKTLTSAARNICPACWVKRGNRRGLRFLVAIPLFGFAGFLLQDVAPALGELLKVLALSGAFLVLAVVPHELGHAITARALGWRVYQVTLGVGEQVCKWRWRDTLIDVRSIPIAGATFMLPCDTRLFRLKFLLSVLAGPFTNGAMAWFTVWGYGGTVWPLDLGPLPKAAHLFVFANLWVVVVNLWPFTSRSGLALASDDKRLLQLVSFRKRALDEVHAAKYMFEAYICREKGDLAGSRAWCDKGLALFPGDTQLLNWSGIMHLEAQNYPAAREVFIKLLSGEKGHSATMTILLNNIAYANALSGNPDWLPEADAYSRDALTLTPWVPAVIGTRGTVLVALGQYKEGLELLKKAMQDADLAHNKSENACHIAIALSRLGQLEEAGKYLRTARELNPKCPLLTRTEEVLDQAKNSVVPPAVTNAEATG